MKRTKWKTGGRRSVSKFMCVRDRFRQTASSVVSLCGVGRKLFSNWSRYGYDGGDCCAFFVTKYILVYEAWWIIYLALNLCKY